MKRMSQCIDDLNARLVAKDATIAALREGPLVAQVDRLTRRVVQARADAGRGAAGRRQREGARGVPAVPPGGDVATGHRVGGVSRCGARVNGWPSVASLNRVCRGCGLPHGVAFAYPSPGLPDVPAFLRPWTPFETVRHGAGLDPEGTSTSIGTDCIDTRARTLEAGRKENVQCGRPCRPGGNDDGVGGLDGHWVGLRCLPGGVDAGAGGGSGGVRTASGKWAMCRCTAASWRWAHSGGSPTGRWATGGATRTEARTQSSTGPATWPPSERDWVMLRHEVDRYLNRKR